MQTRMQKWGNSLGVRIPMKFIRELGLHEGSSINLEIENGHIIIKRPKYDLKEMLVKITPENKHHQLLDDHKKGTEEW